MNIDIKHVAKLSRLKIADNELDKFHKEMSDIIAMCEDLPAMEGSIQIDANNPMTLRTDEIVPSVSREDMLKNAPQTQAGCVVVPKTVE